MVVPSIKIEPAIEPAIEPLPVEDPIPVPGAAVPHPPIPPPPVDLAVSIFDYSCLQTLLH